MIAMELNGSHVKRAVQLTWTSSKRGNKKLSVAKTITKLTHWPNGDVSISQGRYYDPPRYPYHAEVKFLDE